jgi:hypothetical protein
MIARVWASRWRGDSRSSCHGQRLHCGEIGYACSISESVKNGREARRHGYYVPQRQISECGDYDSVLQALRKDLTRCQAPQTRPTRSRRCKQYDLLLQHPFSQNHRLVHPVCHPTPFPRAKHPEYSKTICTMDDSHSTLPSPRRKAEGYG